MAVRPFHEVLAAEGLDLGLEPDLLEFVKKQTLAGKTLSELIEDKLISKASLGPRHLLGIRFEARRFEHMHKAAKDLPVDMPVRNILELRVLRWAMDASRSYHVALKELFPVALAQASVMLKKGRIRMHLTRPQDPGSEEFSDLAEHTEATDALPPHRWFKASRGVAAGLLWLEVITPDESTPGLHNYGPKLRAELRRAMEKPVLDFIAETAQKKVIEGAAQALMSLLSNPPIKGPIAGILMDGKYAYACIVDDEAEAMHRRVDIREMDKLVAWLAKHQTRSVALARIGSKGSLRGVMDLLQRESIPVEPANMAGIMKQARTLPGPIKQVASEVLARRHKDPLGGTEGLEPDELGLGEYLDRVDQDLLRSALNDARQAVAIMLVDRSESSLGRTLGIFNPMVRTMDDLHPGMELSGVVVNLTHFGAFVDLGMEQQGLIHVSEIAGTRIEHPSSVLKVGQHVRARVLKVDLERGRISLSMRDRKNRSRHSRTDARSNAIKALDDLFNK